MQWLEDFLIYRFESFGPYEDSLATSEPTLFHSLLTPMLNIGLLTLQRVVDRALDTGYAHHIERLMVLGNWERMD